MFRPSPTSNFSITYRLKCTCGKYLKLPCCVRAKYWLALIYTKRKLTFDYEKSSLQYKELLELAEEASSTMRKDLSRTFPAAKFFVNGGEGQEQLKRILTAYAVYDSKVGYVQGMNFIAAALLFHASEELAFWLLVSLLEDYEVRDLYLPDMPGLDKHSQILYLLLCTHNVNVFEYLNTNDIRVEFLIMEWVLSLFGSVIVIERMGLFLDEFFQSGWGFFYRLVIHIINKYESEIVGKEGSDMLLGSIRRCKNTDKAPKYDASSFISRIPLLNRLWGKELWQSLIAEALKVEIDERFIRELLSTYDSSTKTFRLS